MKSTVKTLRAKWRFRTFQFSYQNFSTKNIIKRPFFLAMIYHREILPYKLSDPIFAGIFCYILNYFLNMITNIQVKQLRSKHSLYFKLQKSLIILFINSKIKFDIAKK